MNKRCGCQLAVMLLLGMTWIIYSSRACLVAGVLFIPYLAWNLRKHSRPGRAKYILLVLGAAAFVAGAWHSDVYVRQTSAMEELLLAQSSVSFQGEISAKVIKSESTAYYLKEVLVDIDGQTISCPGVIFYPESDDYSIGTILVGQATVSSFYTSRNEGNFSTEDYYNSLGYFATLYDAGVEAVVVPSWQWKESLYKLRVAMAEVYVEVLSSEEGGILATICVGEKAYLEDEAKSLFQLAGIAHILATSGLHISLVGMCLYKLLRRWGRSFAVAGACSFGLAFCYALMCGMSVSATRAVIMFGISLLAAVAGEAYDSLTALALVAVGLAWANPLILTNSGFIFSFLAVVGVVAVGNPLSARFGKPWVSVVGIQLFTLPLLAAFYYEIPLYSLVLNMLLVPMLGVLLGAGLMGGLVGLASISVATPVLMICHYILYLYEWACTATLNLPGARQILGAPKLWQILAFYACLLFFVYVPKKKLVVAAGCLASIIFICLPKTSGFELDILDVDQGDGIYIQSEEGVHFFIDGGSSGISDVGTYRILPFLKYKGIRSIDYWFITHPDSDHFSGLIECIEAGYSIENLVFATAVYQNDNYETIVATAEEYGINIIYIAQGDVVATDSLTLTCVYPAADATSDDPNPLSMTLLLETEGFRALFTGDLAIEQEELLDLEAIGQVDLFKVSHHGSNYSNSSVLLSAIAPTYAVVSCGLNNSYGHPGSDAVARLEAAGCALYYTMNSGQVKVRILNGEVVISTYLD